MRHTLTYLRRLCGTITVAGLLAALCLVLLPAGSAVAATGGGCSSNPNAPRSGPYYLTLDYRNGGHNYCGYYSQDAWMGAVQDAAVSGIHNTGTLESIVVQDASTAAGGGAGMQITATFHQGCPHRSANGLCAVTTSTRYTGNTNYIWSEAYRVHPCGTAPPFHHVAEYDAWNRFLADEGEVDRGNLAGARLQAPSSYTIIREVACTP